MRRDIIRVAIVCVLLFAGFLALLEIVTRNADGQGNVEGAGKFYRLTHAQVDGTLGSDGALTVSERITFEFHGNFSGAYRDIPLPDNQTFEEIGVREGATDYGSGASTELGGFGLPGHLRGRRGARRGRPARRAHRLALLGHRRGAHVPDPLPRPRADEGARRRRRRVLAGVGRRLGGLARPARRDADDPGRRRRGQRAHLGASRQHRRHRQARGPQDRAGGIGRAAPPVRRAAHAAAAHRPRRPTSPGAIVDDEEAFDRIVAEEQADFEQSANDARKLQRVLDNTPLVALAVVLTGLAAAIVLYGLAWLRYGREPEGADAAVTYYPEPPDDAPPAVALALTNQGNAGPGDGDALAATLLDLIVRGRFTTRVGDGEKGPDLLLEQGDPSIAARRAREAGRRHRRVGAEGRADPARRARRPARRPVGLEAHDERLAQGALRLGPRQAHQGRAASSSASPRVGLRDAGARVPRVRPRRAVRGHRHRALHRASRVEPDVVDADRRRHRHGRLPRADRPAVAVGLDAARRAAADRALGGVPRATWRSCRGCPTSRRSRSARGRSCSSTPPRSAAPSASPRRRACGSATSRPPPAPARRARSSTGRGPTR